MKWAIVVSPQYKTAHILYIYIYIYNIMKHNGKLRYEMGNTIITV